MVILKRGFGRSCGSMRFLAVEIESASTDKFLR